MTVAEAPTAVTLPEPAPATEPEVKTQGVAIICYSGEL